MTGDGNWTWFCPGRVPTLVDTGTGVRQHLDAVERALAGARLAQVLVTHAHTDHASGAEAVAARFPGVRFRKMPWPGRDARWPVPWDPIVADELIQAGDSLLRALHTPGHSPDHLCLWHEETRDLLCGDLAQQGNTIYIPANLRGDLIDYMASLARVRALRPARLLPAHGPIIEDPEALLQRYVHHRRHREGQVMDALRRGLNTPAAMVHQIYPGLSEPLLKLAEEGLLAHLVKLNREGRVRRDGDAWHIMDP
jgi:glyoxylase-like metal-dependent hydrolase (beta-lactamase superfamily II)